jgi:uncharacterized membrane protein HdeD (DUF308 family)
VFGGEFLYGTITGPQGGLFALCLIYGILGTAGGICGIAGGLSIRKNKDRAWALLTAAAYIILPYAFVFFLLFMVARNRAAVTEDVWGEKEEL